MFKKIRIEFYKTKGGSKAVYKLYKKTGNLVSDRFPYLKMGAPVMVMTVKSRRWMR